MCDNHLNIHSSSDESMTDSKSNINSCPISPTSLPLSPTTNSPPSQHLPPLQQLDSFTTVFVTTPSTPLSVVSDLHSYEQSSSLSLMSSTSCPKSSKDNSSYITTTNDSKDIQSTPILQLDSSVISSSNTSLNNTSAIIESNEIKVNTEEKDFIDKTLHDFNASEAIAKCQTLNDDKSNQDFNQFNNNDNNNQNIPNSSFEPNNNQIKNESEGVSPKRQNISDDSISSSNNNINLNQENKTLIDEFNNQSKNLNENIENSDIQTKVRGDEEDMSQPMDYCGSNTNTNSSDFTNKTLESIPDCNIMDETLSQSEQSDQSEPMDED